MRKSILNLLIIVLCYGTVNAASDPLNQRQKDIIRYFKEIALGFEYGTATGITRKWKEPMRIFVGGDVSKNVLQELHRVVGELNELVSDGFHIEIVSVQAESNFYIYFGKKDEFLSLYPTEAETVKTSSGIFRIFWNKSNLIQHGYAFIHNQTSEKEQCHSIREELTQALGLGKDSPLYDDSIFQSRWTLPTEYAEIDKALIRYLYHPRMRVGLGDEEVEHVLTEIFIAEQSQSHL